MRNTPRYVILGGGIAGLAAGLELLKRNAQVTILEKKQRVGGLARTIEIEGFRFDLGGHRFHSNNPQVVAWLKQLLGKDLLQVDRSSRIYTRGKFVDYPLQMPEALSIFPLTTALHMGIGYLQAALSNGDKDERSFQDWVVHRFGDQLFEAFFRPYTEKVWGIPCDQISADWAAMRIGIPSLWEAVKRTIIPYRDAPPTAITRFYYPRSGFGAIPERIADHILKMGGHIHTGSELYQIDTDGDVPLLTARNDRGDILSFAADQVISTIPIPVLLKALPKQTGSDELMARNPLDYRSMICVLLTFDQARISRDHWTYFPGEDFIFGRTHEPKNWSPAMAPGGSTTSLCAEIFTGRDHAHWQTADEQLIANTLNDLVRIGWVDPARVTMTKVVRIPHAYPIYDLHYGEKLIRIKDFLRQWRWLHLLGRTGSFKYMNSDGVIEDVFRFIEQQLPTQQAFVQPLSQEAERWA